MGSTRLRQKSGILGGFELTKIDWTVDPAGVQKPFFGQRIGRGEISLRYYLVASSIEHFRINVTLQWIYEPLEIGSPFDTL